MPAVVYFPRLIKTSTESYMRNIKFVILHFGLLAACSAVALADISNTVEIQFDSQCAGLVKECFAYDTNERANCFYSSSTHPFCEGTALGKLAYKRWSMSPVKLPMHDAPGLLGPQLIDGECISSFDNQWFGRIVDTSLSSDQLQKLESTLDSCKKKELPSLPRP